MDAAEPEAPCLPVLDLPAPCLRGVLLRLAIEDVASFASACAQAAAACDDQMLWRELVLQRFGPSVLPALPPAPGSSRPQELPGWLFYQGVDASRDTDSAAPGAAAGMSPEQLAEACKAAGAEAFTVPGGRLVQCLDTPQPAWRRVSYCPAVGMYVRQEVVEYRCLDVPPPPAAAAAAAGSEDGRSSTGASPAGSRPSSRDGLRQRRRSTPGAVGGPSSSGGGGQQGEGSLATSPRSPGEDPPQHSRSRSSAREATPATPAAAAAAAAAADNDGASWPPSVPGWVYYPSVTCPGFFAEEPPASLSRYASLAALLDACARRRDIVAVTPAGETKRSLRLPSAWRVDPSYDVGLYVKEEVVRTFNLPPPNPAPDFRALAARLHQLRLPASAMDAAWLDDQHLQLLVAPDAPAGGDGVVLKLKDVWWLDINGAIPGVLPGEYEIVWLVDGTSSQTLSYNVFNLSAMAVPNNPGQAQGQGQQQQQQQQASVTLEVRGEQLLQQMGAQRVTRARPWLALPGGTLRVAQASTVHLRFWSLEQWKAGLRWARAELRPLGAAAAQQAGRRERYWLQREQGRGLGRLQQQRRLQQQGSGLVVQGLGEALGCRAQ